ncbi:MAG: Rab family GTPase [Candidatus Helarchaeota archaeon]
MNIDNNIYRYKMILFGSAGVGKTSLVERFVNDKFEENYISTLGYNVYEKWVTINETTVVSLMIYDIGGQERFIELRKKYAEGANTAFLVYDITDQESFVALRNWKADLFSFAGEIPFILIGNKIDLEEFREISLEQGRQMAEELGALSFFETSAKTGEAVEKAFIDIAIETYRKLVKD